jgi:hypothetical protein
MRELGGLIVSPQLLVRCAGFQVVGGMERQFKKCPPRKPMATLPGMVRTATLPLLSPQTMVLKIVHVFK